MKCCKEKVTEEKRVKKRVIVTLVTMAISMGCHGTNVRAEESRQGETLHVTEELMEGLTIDADIRIPGIKYRTYQTVSKEFDPDTAAALLMPEAGPGESTAESDDSKASLSFGEQRLSMSPGYLRYTKDAEITYISQLVEEAEDMGILEKKELGFMKAEEAERLVKYFLEQMNLGAVPENVTAVACTAENLAEAEQYLLEYDEHFRGLKEAGKFPSKEGFSQEDEIYYIPCVFYQDGIPVLGTDEPEVYTFGGIDSAPPSLPMDAVFYVGASGIRLVSLMNVVDGDLVPSAEEEIIQTDGIIEALRSRYGDVILQETITVTDIWLEYMPIRGKENYREITLTPAWCCRLTVTGDGDASEAVYAERFHAVTGELIA